jgi:hypothetical protein
VTARMSLGILAVTRGLKGLVKRERHVTGNSKAVEGGVGPPPSTALLFPVTCRSRLTRPLSPRVTARMPRLFAKAWLSGNDTSPGIAKLSRAALVKAWKYNCQ